MPELPEVETLRRNLVEYLPGCRILGVEVRLAKIVVAEPGLAITSVLGARIESVWRRAKYLIFDLDGERSLVFHLRLSGQIVLRQGERTLVAGGHPVPRFDAVLPHKSTHLIFELEPAGQPEERYRLYLTDIRQFGFVRVMSRDRVKPYLVKQALGPDALDPDLDATTFGRILSRRRSARLKPMLLDQTAISGLGNIYADESLFLARLHPLRAASSLDEGERGRLLRGIRDALEYALEKGVAVVLNGRAAPGGVFPRVHGRASEPCFVCGTPIERIHVVGRSTYFCPSCQPAPVDTAAD